MWKIKKFNELSTLELFNILKERSKIFVLEQNCPYLDIDDDDLSCLHVFKEINGEIGAYFRLIEKENYIKLGRVIVKKELRKQGLGKELLNKFLEVKEKYYKDKDGFAQAQAHLINFYGSIGFKEISKPYYEDNILHVDMILKK